MKKETYKQARLTMFQYILNKQQIEFNNYILSYPIRRIEWNIETRKRTEKEIFNYLLTNVNKILKELNLNCDYITHKETSYYIFKKIRINFNINILTKEKRKKYMFEIIYLYLINSKYINLTTLNNLFGPMKKETFYQIRKELEPILPGELKLNRKSGSYELHLFE